MSKIFFLVLFVALISMAPVYADQAKNKSNLQAADGFAVIGGSALTFTDSIINGNVAVYPGTTVTNTRSTVIGTVYAGDIVAQLAYESFLSTYDALAGEQCGTLLSGNLAGLVLPPGVYCVEAASTTTGGVLTLAGSSSDTWIFKIGTLGTGALTGTNFSVVMSSGETCNNNVFWWVAEAATLTDSTFIGSILAGSSITITGGSFDGQALAKVAVTLTNTTVSFCGTPPPPPPPPVYPPIKVTGGGQIAVPDPNSTGRATFGFNAQLNKSGGAKGHFNYLNHVTNLHVNGEVTNIQVIAVNLDGTPKTVLFSGTWDGGFFFVTVEDHGEPGTTDEFGITVTTATGELSELRSQRIIKRGNIQFH